MSEEKVLTGKETEIMQVGVIVKDLNKTIDFLTKLGLGPFDKFFASHPSATVRGKKAAYSVETAGSQLGAVQLELIEHQSGETVQKEFLDEKGEGMHHILFRVSDLDATIEKFSKQGVQVLQQDRFVGGGGMAYMGTDDIGGMVIELVQYPDDFDSEKGLEYQA